MSKGVVAVLGPSASPASNSIISNICGEKEVSVCTQLAFSHWLILNSMFTVQLELQSLEQWNNGTIISRCFFLFFLRGMKSLLVKMMKYLNSDITLHSSPTQIKALLGILFPPVLSLAWSSLAYFIETNTKSTDIDQTSPSCCLKSGV